MGRAQNLRRMIVVLVVAAIAMVTLPTVFSLASPTWSGTGHFVTEAIGYIPSGYTVPPNFRQASTSNNAAQSVIGSVDTADTFVNFALDTYGKTVYLVYTTNGSAPTKSNGTVAVASFSNYADPNRTWRASIPPQAANTVVNYLFYISDGSLANGWARISGTPAARNTSQYQTTWTETDGAYFTYTVSSAASGAITVTGAKALWLDANTIAWNGVAGANYKLLYDPNGRVTTDAENTACAFSDPSISCYVTLTESSTISGYAKNPNATGMRRLTSGLSSANAKFLLKGQVVVASYNSDGGRLDATRAQIQSVLDALYVDATPGNGTAEDAVLGVTYSGNVPTVRVWAPTAKSVELNRYDTATGALTQAHTMTLDATSGVWSVTAPDSSWDRQYYLFDVEVYVPSLDAVTHNLVSDPYAISLSADTTAATDPRSQLVNLADTNLKPDGWDSLAMPPLTNFEDIVIYETHIRDFSIKDTSVTNSAYRGTYLAFTYDGRDDADDRAKSNGMDHLQKLQAAGLTHIHLLPAFDIASVPENSVPRSVSPSPTGYGRAAEEPQSIVGTGRATDGFNWGYDPHHYGAPEGSYATDPDGAARVLEFREMVKALSDNGLRVAMDVVYNHTAASGQTDKSVLDRVVPGYYYRYNKEGALYTDSCCDDTASEYAMFEKLMIDTLKRWAIDYKVDSFRFDLMNFHTKQNMLNVKAALQSLTSGANGVDGSKIYLYGEGWDFGSALAKGLTTCPNCYAKQANMTGTGIGSFNDKIRDAAHGGYSTDDLGIRKQGYINGLSYDWNDYYYSNRDASDLNTAMDILRSGLRASGTDWNNQGQPFTDDPQESVPYVEKHDNETLFDQNVFKLPSATSMADRVRVQNLGTSVIALAQGVPFFQMGQDILRSKSLDRNSYDSGDWFNRVDWSYGDGTYTNNFGVGLPPAWDNQSRWDIMTPLLNNTALDPAATDAQASAAHLREMLRIRKSSPLFRLTTEALINERVGFRNTANTPVGLLVMSLSDDVGATGLDPTYGTILVFFNANKTQASFTIAGASNFSLHPIQNDTTDADPIVKMASFDDGTDTFTIPARTTAVFVSAEAITPPLVTSTIDWVGLMWPRGGSSAQRPQGASTTGYDVFVQVYEQDLTPTAGAPDGISCYLYWGKYGQAWNTVAMTWHEQEGSNDEFKGTIPKDDLNALTAGQVGYTAYCQRIGEDKKWKAVSTNIGGQSDDYTDFDVDDGVISITPNADIKPAPAGGVFVHLFEWRWIDIQKECPYLASKGYTGVQVSPLMEHLVPVADLGNPANDYPWWVRYQPVSYSLGQSRSGTQAEFQAMVAACNAVGVDIIADAVINHMTGPGSSTTTYVGTNGSQYRKYQYPYPAQTIYQSLYGAGDFHGGVGACPSASGEIDSYKDRRQVQKCELSGLADLNTGAGNVQATIRTYLQSLLDMGVKGFRIDGAKHIAAHDLAAILTGLTSPSGSFYVFQEVIDSDATEPVKEYEYFAAGDVTEFGYSIVAIGEKFNGVAGGTLADLSNLSTWNILMDSQFALVFTDNHDNQRGHGPGGSTIVDHRDGQLYNLANIFMLGHSYGDYVSVMSSYYWSNDPNSQAGDSKGPPSATAPHASGSGPDTRPVYVGDVPANCSPTFEDGKWVCEHRRTAIANMVRFRWVTDGQAVSNWQNVGGASSNHIAFGRGSKGFVAINRTGSAAAPTYTTGMADGVYCDVTQGELTNSGAACTGRTITVSGGQISGFSLPAMDAFAIHVGQKVRAAGDPAYGWWTWDPVDGAASYRVLREENDPYFAADPATQTMWVTLSTSFYDPDAATADAAINHFYLVQALDEAGRVLSSQRVGEFTFGVTPGN